MNIWRNGLFERLQLNKWINKEIKRGMNSIIGGIDEWSIKWIGEQITDSIVEIMNE